MKSFSEGKDFLIWRFLNGTTLCEEPWCRMHKMPFFSADMRNLQMSKSHEIAAWWKGKFCFDEKNTSLQDKNDNAIVITIQVPKTQRCWWWKLFFFLCQIVLSTFVTSCEQICETLAFLTYFFVKVLNFLGIHSKGLIIVVTRFPLIKALVSLAFDMWVRS